MKKLYSRIYYVVSFRPKRTVNNKMRGNEHYMSNEELARMRTNEILKFITLKNVFIIYTSKLNKWTRLIFHRKRNISD